jgi:energy-coupling factor transporter transmembrane protein EcfT
MNRKKKPLKFYLIIFLFSTLIIAAYSLYMIFVKNAVVSDIYTLWFMPLLFTLFYWGSDTIILKFSNKKKKVDYEAKFLDEISNEMRNSKEFIVEEFRRLQINQKFQEDLKRAYQIHKNGESGVLTIEKLENKYRKNSIEKRPLVWIFYHQSGIELFSI